MAPNFKRIGCATIAEPIAKRQARAFRPGMADVDKRRLDGAEAGLGKVLITRAGIAVGLD
jgi:hypothetical protein